MQTLSATPLVSSVTDYGDVAVKPPIIHGAVKSVAPRLTSPTLIGSLDPARSIFLHPCFFLWPISPYPGKMRRKIPWLRVILYSHLSYKAQFLLILKYSTFSRFISPVRTYISSAFSVPFRTHCFAHMGQSLINIQSFFILAVAQLPMLYSDSFLCFCSLLIFQLAGFLLRPIGLYLGNSGLSREIFRAYLLRCALVYRHNDIIVLIIGKSNTYVFVRNWVVGGLLGDVPLCEACSCGDCCAQQGTPTTNMLGL